MDLRRSERSIRKIKKGIRNNLTKRRRNNRGKLKVKTANGRRKNEWVDEKKKKKKKSREGEIREWRRTQETE